MRSPSITWVGDAIGRIPLGDFGHERPIAPPQVTELAPATPEMRRSLVDPASLADVLVPGGVVLGVRHEGEDLIGRGPDQSGVGRGGHETLRCDGDEFDRSSRSNE
jgi:hypothetical protein